MNPPPPSAELSAALRAARDAAVVVRSRIACRARHRRARCARRSCRDSCPTTSTRSPTTAASSRATTRPRAGCSPISCCGASPGRGISRAACPPSSPTRVRKRLSMYVLRVEGDAARRECAIRSGSALAVPAQAPAVRAALGVAPDIFGVARSERRDRSRLARAPLLRDRAGRTAPRTIRSALLAHASRRAVCGVAMADDPRRRPGRDLGDAGPVRRADGESRRAGRRRFQEGLLHRPGDHRAHAIPRAAQGAAVRVPRAGRRRRRRRAPLQQRLPRTALRHRRQRGTRARRRIGLHRRAADRGGGIRRRAARRRRRPAASRRCRCRMRCRRRRPPRRGASTCAEARVPRMCLALVALDAHPRYPLVVAANRDEHHARPAAPARWWDEGWLGGRDLRPAAPGSA